MPEIARRRGIMNPFGNNYQAAPSLSRTGCSEMRENFLSTDTLPPFRGSYAASRGLLRQKRKTCGFWSIELLPSGKLRSTDGRAEKLVREEYALTTECLPLWKGESGTIFCSELQEAGAIHTGSYSGFVRCDGVRSIPTHGQKYVVAIFTFTISLHIVSL
jgi:hypothetical protein